MGGGAALAAPPRRRPRAAVAAAALLLLLLAPPSGGQTAGCGSPPPATSGTIEFLGASYPYFLTFPAGYDGAQPLPIVYAFHGWGMRADGSNAGASTNGHFGWLRIAPDQGYIGASLQGISDGNMPNSWHGFGSAESPGPSGAVCADPTTNAYTPKCKNATNATNGTTTNCTYYETKCYPTCHQCTEGESGDAAGLGHHNRDEFHHNCWWTTCLDSVAQVVKFMDMLDTLLCIDRTRVYGAGVSNGAMFQYELAQDPRTAGRFAAHATIVGSPHPGWNLGPNVTPTPFIGMWGSDDHWVPGNCSNSAGSFTPVEQESCMSDDGWYFVTADSVTKRWIVSNGCVPVGVGLSDWEPHEPASVAAYLASPAAGGPITCVKPAACPDGGVGDVVKCTFPGGHNGITCSPPGRASEGTPCGDALFHITWDFLRNHSRPNPAYPTASPQSSAPIAPPPPQTSAGAAGGGGGGDNDESSSSPLIAIPIILVPPLFIAALVGFARCEGGPLKPKEKTGADDVGGLSGGDTYELAAATTGDYAAAE